MQVKIDERERAAVTVVLRSARSVLKQEQAGSGGRPEISERLREGQSMLESLERRVTNLELGYQEAAVLESILRHMIGALDAQGSDAQGAAVADLKANKETLQGLQKRVKLYRVDLTSYEGMALQAVLNDTIRVLENGGQASDEATGAVHKAVEVLQGLQKRLTGIELSADEAEWVRGSILPPMLHALQAEESNLAAGALEDLQRGEILLLHVGGRLRDGFVELTAPENAALASVLFRTLSASRDELGKTSAGEKSQKLKSSADRLEDLCLRLWGLEVTESEAALLNDVLTNMLDSLEEEREKSPESAEANQTSAEWLQKVLHRLSTSVAD